MRGMAGSPALVTGPPGFLAGDLIVRGYLVRRDRGPLGGAEPGGGEDLLDYRALRLAVLVDVCRGRAGAPFHLRVPFPQARVGAQDAADGQVVAQRQRAFCDDVGVGPG